jgi:hypothetical protein
VRGVFRGAVFHPVAVEKPPGVGFAFQAAEFVGLAIEVEALLGLGFGGREDQVGIGDFPGVARLDEKGAGGGFLEFGRGKSLDGGEGFAQMGLEVSGPRGGIGDIVEEQPEGLTGVGGRILHG